MKRQTFYAFFVCAFMGSCSQSDELINNVAKEDTTVTLAFEGIKFDMQPMGTRATIAESASRLDVWVYENGSEVGAVHQTSSDSGFGTVSLTLNNTKTYTLYAFAHKATGVCTLTDGIIAFPEDKPKECFFYTTTFSPATITAINAEMYRVCGRFTMSTTDAIPDNVDHVQFVIRNTALRYGVDGTLSNITDRTVDFPNITRKADGTCSFSFNILASDAVANFEITATAYASDNSVIETKTFTDVPIRNSYRTTYTGAFFTTSEFFMTFTCADWQDYDTVTF